MAKICGEHFAVCLQHSACTKELPWQTGNESMSKHIFSNSTSTHGSAGGAFRVLWRKERGVGQYYSARGIRLYLQAAFANTLTVSSRWYNIAMGTPKLWSTIVLSTSLWHECTASPGIPLSFLNCVESWRKPSFEVAALRRDPHQQSVFELLSSHASRWRDATFWSDRKSCQYMAGVKGNLERLEILHVDASWDGLDIFRVAPRSTEVEFAGKLKAAVLLAFDNNVVTFAFDADLTNVSFDDPWPSISSDVQSLTFEVAVLHSPVDPSLTRRDRHSPPVWMPEHFMTLAERSSFRNHLTALEIHAIAMDGDLLRCLSVLPVLKELWVCDCTFSREEHTVITDTLLKGLVRRTHDTSLILKLEFICLTSFSEFTDSSFLEFVASCVGRDLAQPFDLQVWWLPELRRELLPATLAQLSGFVSRGKLWFYSSLIEVVS
ncbi:hypothetical protein FB451DRAFT_1164720 [Mycena latifolia]|nr:hypothetical protein FB451DRAFT_1164720 [Mycena latifolia]